MTEPITLHPQLTRLRFPALLAGLACLLISALALLGDSQRPHFFLAYLHAYLFWFGIALGSFALLLLQHMTGGRWGLSLRRLLEAGTRTIPLMAILFIPIVLGMHHLYVWTHDGFFTHHPDNSPIRPWWLRSNFFILRAIVYFLAWIFVGLILDRWSIAEDRGQIPPNSRRRWQRIGSFGILVYALTLSFASIDWVMSLAPHWFSTIFGMLFMVSQALSALCAMVALLVLLSSDRGPLAELTSPSVFQDLGNLMLAFTMLWAYVNFSQLLIIWSGNLAEEVPFYVYRTVAGWKIVNGLLILFHFALPFVILLNRFVKRRGRYLAYVACFILLTRLVDLFWLIVPTYNQGQHKPDTPFPDFWQSFHWTHLLLPIGIGGIFLFFFIGQLARRPLVPSHDPRLQEVSHAH